MPTSDKVAGVPEFVAPEQLDGKPVDQRSNLYSLGALYYFVLTGQTVFAARSTTAPRARSRARSGRRRSWCRRCPQPIEAVILRALDRSPTKRFLTVRQFVDEVGRVAVAAATVSSSTMPMGKAEQPRGELVQTLLGVT